MQKHSPEQIIQILQNLSKRIGKKTLSQKEVARVISPSVVRYHFGSLGDALEAAGLDRTPPTRFSKGVNQTPRLSDDDLFVALLEVEQKLGKEPGINDLAHGSYSRTPYQKRFGKWSEVRRFYRKWKADNPLAKGEATPVPSALEMPEESKEVPALIPSQKIRQKAPAQLYGGPIDFRGLRHAPINEQGVVFLFGMVSRELGFGVEAIQQGFPDCESKYLHDEKRNLWAKARIEFEYKASSFKEHGHNADHCDFIVCWENDWADCPINVIELKTEILKLPPM